MIDIESMTTSEWLDYRDQKLENFYAKGHKLVPTQGCSDCDPDEDYTCFACECLQIEGAENE